MLAFPGAAPYEYELRIAACIVYSGLVLALLAADKNDSDCMGIILGVVMFVMFLLFLLVVVLMGCKGKLDLSE